jgi:hypothetical protein
VRDSRFRRKNISRAIRAAAERMCVRVGRRWPHGTVWKRAKERGVRFGRPHKALQRLAAGETQAEIARSSMNAAKLRNLAARPAKPNLNRGPIQVRARRALRALGEASTSQISEWAHPRGGSRRRTDYTRRVLARIAVKVGRALTRGSPWLWKLADPGA